MEAFFTFLSNGVIMNNNETINDEVPLIWTTKGNLPVDSLAYRYGWEITEDYYKFEEHYYLDDELVKSNCHVYSTKGVESPIQVGGVG